MEPSPVSHADVSYTYRFSWDPAVFRLGNRQVMRYAKHPAWLGWLLKLAPWFVGIVFAIWLALAIINRDWDTLARSSPWFLLILGWFGFLVYGTGWLGARAWEKRHPPGHREIVVAVNAAGFHTSSYPGELRLNWAAMLQVVETNDFFLFYLAPQMAHYLPKAEIPSADLSALRALFVASKGPAFRMAPSS